MIIGLRLSFSMPLYDYLTFLDTWVIEFQSVSSNQDVTRNVYPLDSISMQFKRYALLQLDFDCLLFLSLCIISSILKCLPAISNNKD